MPSASTVRGYFIFAQIMGWFAGIAAFAGFVWNLLADPLPHPLAFIPYWLVYGICIPIFITAIISLNMISLLRGSTGPKILAFRNKIRLLIVLSIIAIGFGVAFVGSYFVIGFIVEEMFWALALLGGVVTLQVLSLIGWTLAVTSFDERGYLK
jgi:hypothetical protein